jgi:hypothetical protein
VGRQRFLVAITAASTPEGVGEALVAAGEALARPWLIRGGKVMASPIGGAPEVDDNREIAAAVAASEGQAGLSLTKAYRRAFRARYRLEHNGAEPGEREIRSAIERYRRKHKKSLANLAPQKPSTFQF